MKQCLLGLCMQKTPLFCISSICFTGTLGWLLRIRYALRDGALQSKTMFVGVWQIPAEP